MEPSLSHLDRLVHQWLAETFRLPIHREESAFHRLAFHRLDLPESFPAFRPWAMLLHLCPLQEVNLTQFPKSVDCRSAALDQTAPHSRTMAGILQRSAVSLGSNHFQKPILQDSMRPIRCSVAQIHLRTWTTRFRIHSWFL